MVLDASFCRVWHGKWLRHLASDSSVAIYASCDSSPQFGADWMISEIRIVKGAVAAMNYCNGLRSMLPDDAGSKQALHEWMRTLSQQDIESLRWQSMNLCGLVEKHVLTPSVIGGRHASVAHKLHAFLHQCKVDTGSWGQVQALLAALQSMTTDQGTERLLADIPSSWSKMQSSVLLPKMKDCDITFAVLHEPPKPPYCPLAKKRGPELSVGASKRPREEQPDDGDDTDPDMPGLSGPDPFDDLFPEMAETIEVDDEDDVPEVLIPYSSCCHPGCEEEVWSTCVHCLATLCHRHCPSGSGSAGRHVWINNVSRCHEHWRVPVGQRSLVHTQCGKGSLRCPCYECREARGFTFCPCPGEFCSGSAYLLTNLLTDELTY